MPRQQTPQALQTHLTQSEAAERLRVPVSTLKTWRRRRYGPRFFHLGRRVYYDAGDLTLWLEVARLTGTETSGPY